MSQLIEHSGVIEKIEGTNFQVRIIQVSACSGCHAKSACSAADMDEKIVDIQCLDSSLKVGDTVRVFGTSSMGLFAVFIAFVVPFILILVSLLVISSFTGNESLAGILALAILIPYFGIVSIFKKRIKSKLQFSIEKF
jgi:sigma-E factor negative regulatory protein RseC